MISACVHFLYSYNVVKIPHFGNKPIGSLIPQDYDKSHCCCTETLSTCLLEVNNLISLKLKSTLTFNFQSQLSSTPVKTACQNVLS